MADVPKGKTRLDTLLTARGLFESREAARRAIMAGLVKRRGTVLDKPGTFVIDSDDIEVTKAEHPFVSRGGLKLEKALTVFPVSVSGKVVIDVGASTGGFTDCALQHGAAHVHSVDVGYGQLAWKLRNDPRVSVFERLNFRHADAEVFKPKPTTAVMDVSFISIRLLIPKLNEVLLRPSDVLSLIKPQFEAGRTHVGKGGIVREPRVHVQVLRDVLTVAEQHGWSLGGLDYSPITGGDGNIEFLAWWQISDEPSALSSGVWKDHILEVVVDAWMKVRGEDVRHQVSEASGWLSNP